MKRLIFLLLICCCSTVWCQNLRVDEKKYHWEGGLYAGFNTDGYELDAGVAYYFHSFIGIRCGIGWSAEMGKIDGLINALYPDDTVPPYYFDDDDDDRLSRFRFTSAAVLRSPCLFDWKSQAVQIYAFAEPGVVLATPAVGSHNARWFNLMLRAGLNMQIDRWVITLGYGISDFSLTSGFRHFENPNHLTNTVFIGSAYKF